MSQPKIIAYMKPVCGWSNGVRAIFAKYGLDYEDRDIINNQDNYREMVQKTRQPYQPCVQIDDIILADVSGMDRLLMRFEDGGTLFGLRGYCPIE